MVPVLNLSAQLKVQRSPSGRWKQVGFVLGQPSLQGGERIQSEFSQEYQNEQDPVCALADLLTYTY